jgi:hypothetical protein
VLAYCLETSGELAFEHSDHERAAVLLGASADAFEKLEIAMAPEEADGYARVLEELRARLGSDRVDELHASGHAAPFEESIGAALDPA